MPSGPRPSAPPPPAAASDGPAPAPAAPACSPNAQQPVHSAASTSASATHKKRRVLSACVRCATKKVKCDGRNPCSVCSSLGLGDQCKFNPNPKKRGPPKGYWDAQRKLHKEQEARPSPHSATDPSSPAKPAASSSKMRKRKRAAAQHPAPLATSAPPPPGPAPWQRFTQPAGPEFLGSIHKLHPQAPPAEPVSAPAPEGFSSTHPPRPRLPPLADMRASAPPPLLSPPRRAAPTLPPQPRNMFGLNPPPPAVTDRPVQDPTTLTPLESRLIEIYIAFVHDHWPLLAPNILFAPALGAAGPDPVPALGDPSGSTARPSPLSSYIASLKGKVPLLFQLICCTAANTLMQNWARNGANIVAGIPVQPGEVVTGEDLDKLVEKCRVALMPFAHIRAVWVVQALFLLALADYSAGRVHEGWQSTGLVCRLVFDMNLHRSQGEVAVKRMMRLAADGSDPSSAASATSGAAQRVGGRYVQAMLTDIAQEEHLIAQEERAMYAAAGAYTVEEIIQVRRRIFWSSFVLDKFVSVLTERPCMLRYAEVDVSFPNPSSLGDTQPWLTWSSVMFVQPNVIPELKGVPARIDSCFSVVSQLCVITEHILDVLYSPTRRIVPNVPDLARGERPGLSDSSPSYTEGLTVLDDEGGVMASRWLPETLALGEADDPSLSPPGPERGLAQSYLRIMRMITLWSEYIPACMRARRMPLTYAQPLPPDVNPLGPTNLFVMPPRHAGSPPSFLSMRAWTHLNVLLLHRPFIVRPHLLSFSLEQLRKNGFAPTLPAERAERASQQGAAAPGGQQGYSATKQHPTAAARSQASSAGMTSSSSHVPSTSAPSHKKPKQMKVSITSLLVEQRRHRAKSTSAPANSAAGAGQRPMGPAVTGPSTEPPGVTKTGGSVFLLPLSHAAQVCIQAAAEIIDIADAYKGLYPPRKLPHIWVYMLFQAGTVVSSFSIQMSPVLSPSKSAGWPVEAVDPNWLQRAHDTAARCRSLLSRCLASLQEIEVSHPSTRILTRILHSLSDVAATVNAAASSSPVEPSVSTARGTDTHLRPAETDAGPPTRSIPAPPIGTVPEGGPQHGPGTAPHASHPDALMLLAHQAETERTDTASPWVEGSRHTTLDPSSTWTSPHLQAHATPQTQAQAQARVCTEVAELSAWEQFWDRMPFGANWDSWRDFFILITQADMPGGYNAGDEGSVYSTGNNG